MLLVNIRHSKKARTLAFGFSLVTLLCVPDRSRAAQPVMLSSISGTAEMRYIQYDAEESGASKVSANSLAQRYSLLYEISGKAREERFGKYRLGLGYRWASIDSKISTDKEEKVSIQDGKFNYKGELLFDPPAWPLRLRMYSGDQGSNTVSVDSLASLSAGAGFMVAPNIPTTMSNAGTNINSGFTLVFGEKSGMTSNYAKVFSLLPMALVDYKDVIQRNLAGQFKIDQRTRRLAFTSLNKGDNWIHYRAAQFDDYINPLGSYVDSQVQIGLIDNLQRRNWTDLTNWIKISADGQLTKHSAREATANYEEYDLNLFATATRRNWEARNFINFNRRRGSTSLSESRRLPVYVSGVWGAETDWKVRLSSSSSRDLVLQGGTTTRNSNALDVRINTFNRSLFTLATSFAVEHSSDSQASTNTAFDLGVTTDSTGRFSRDVHLGSSYHVKSFLAKDSKGAATTYLNQELSFDLRYAPNQALSLAASEQVQTGSGTNPNASGNAVVQANPGLQSDSGTLLGTNRDQNVNEYLRSLSRFTAFWEPLARLNTSLVLSYDLFSRPGQPLDSSAALAHMINYQLNSFTIALGNNIKVRDDGGNPAVMEFASDGSIHYRPETNLNMSVRSRYSRIKDATRSSTFLTVVQKAMYSFTSARGASRRLADLVEEFSVSQNSGDFPGQTGSNKAFQLSGHFYPTTRISLTGSAGFRLTETSFEQVYGAGIGMNMSIMDATVDYTYAKRDTDNRIEKRLAAAVRKSF